MKKLILFLLFLSLSSPAVASTPPAAKSGTELSDVLARIEQAASQVNSLASDFVQEKHLEIFDEVLVSKGRFYYGSPDRLRWELTEPVPSGFVLKGERGRRWHNRTGQMENFEIDRNPAMKLIAEQLLAWTRIDFPLLQKQYRISLEEEEPVALRLVPLAEGADAYLNHLRIVFAADNRHVSSVEIFEKDGDFTLIRFLDTVVNQPLAEGLF